MRGILLPVSKGGINVAQDKLKIPSLGRAQFARNGPRLRRLSALTTKPASRAGFLKYRYGDSNPGFRRERAAS
jgi:hypothetical protein